MQFKKILPIILITLIAFTGCKSNTVPKDQLVTEEGTTQEIQNEEIKENITMDKALEISLEAFEKYFNEEVDTNKLQQKISLFPDPTTPNPYWSLIWNSPQSIQKENRIIEYLANIDSATGNIMNLSARNIDLSKERQKFDLEEAKKIALNFIKEHDIHTMDDIEFVKNNDGGEMNPQEDEAGFYLDFKSINDLNKSIFIEVDKTEKKVVSFGITY